MLQNTEKPQKQKLRLIVSIINNPNRNLDEKTKDILQEEILDLTRSSWGDYEKEKINNNFLKLDQIILGRIKNELCFITGGKWEHIYYKNNRVPVYRIGLTVVRKFTRNREYLWNKGIMSNGILSLLKSVLLRNSFKSFYVVFRTLEPVTYQSVVKNLNYVLPDFQGRIRPNDKEKSIALQVSKIINPICNFDEDKFIIRQAFAKNLTLAKVKLNQVEQFKNEKIKKFFMTNLDYNQGDAFIVLTKVNILIFLKYQLKKFLRCRPRNFIMKKSK